MEATKGKVASTEVIIRGWEGSFSLINSQMANHHQYKWYKRQPEFNNGTKLK